MAFKGLFDLVRRKPEKHVWLGPRRQNKLFILANKTKKVELVNKNILPDYFVKSSRYIQQQQQNLVLFTAIMQMHYSRIAFSEAYFDEYI